MKSILTIVNFVVIHLLSIWKTVAAIASQSTRPASLSHFRIFPFLLVAMAVDVAPFLLHRGSRIDPRRRRFR